MSDETYELREGQTWRSKRDFWRRVTITGLTTVRGDPAVNVRRNTSRRTQAIREVTLRRDYYIVTTNTPGERRVSA